VAQGMHPPEMMAQMTVPVNIESSVEDGSQILVNSLKANRPNPFRQATAIRYTLAKREHAKIAVYDVNGRRVRTLVDGVQDPGELTLRWDGRNDEGRDLAPGVYFVRYRVGNDLFWRKITKSAE
jgi:flagellar hook assembly protein FlgD